MAADLISSEIEQIEQTLSHQTKWLGKELQQRASSVASPHLNPDADITLYAHVEAAPKRASLLKVGTWKASDLYAYSDAPRIELLNVFGQLLDACDKIAAAYDKEDFELKTIDLWAQLAALNNFLGISSKHDEIIATLQLLPTAAVGVLDNQKLAVIKKSLTLLHESINLTDELLDEIADDLEASGFDLEAPMRFNESSG